MLFFEPNSEITIGSFKFSGLHEVRINRGLHDYRDRAIITIPSIGVIQGKRSVPVEIPIANLFTDGDMVIIKLGYDGDLKTEFEGFVKRRSLDELLTVECEGYVRQLRLNVDITKNFKKTSAKELLLEATKGTDISVQCPVDFPMSGIKMLHADGCKIIDHIKKCSERALNIFFIEPKMLWCGLTYTPYLAGTEVFNLPTVGYRLGWNTPKNNDLKERVPSEPVEIILNGITITGDSVRTDTKDKTAKRKEKYYLNNIPSADTLKQFALELQSQANYTGYEGKLNAFLTPYCLPGYVVNIIDNRFPERNGKYLAESTEVTFGINGARRKIEIGPKIGK